MGGGLNKVNQYLISVRYLMAYTRSLLLNPVPLQIIDNAQNVSSK